MGGEILRHHHVAGGNGAAPIGVMLQIAPVGAPGVLTARPPDTPGRRRWAP